MIGSGLSAYAARGADWAAWLDRLPGLLRQILEEWELAPDGEANHRSTALVMPVVTGDAEGAAVLKISWPGWESEHEHLALQHWHGEGAVRLLRADPHRRALVLERLSPHDLGDHWDVQACEIVGDLYRRLHVPAPPQLRTLSWYADRVADRLAALPPGTPLPPRFVDQARSLAASFAADPATDGRLLHTDLHYGNVLAGARVEGEPAWLAIDPKPLSGDPHYEVAPLLWNRFDELAGRVREGIRDRFFAAVDAAGLEEERARDWVVVRMLDLARQSLHDADLLTRCVTIAKAVQG
ncbi:streptomycin 6-kinase [Nocardioides sp. AN3]